MLEVCRKKAKELNLQVTLLEATFESFSLEEKYNLIFIPSGSFCHLITPKQVSQALAFIVERLNPGGKFVFEVETLRAVREPQRIWRGKWVDKPDGAKIVANILTQFDPISRLETGLFRYELWKKNEINLVEVEEYQVRHYEPKEIEDLLDQHGLKVINKWQIESNGHRKATDMDAVILYECHKD